MFDHMGVLILIVYAIDFAFARFVLSWIFKRIPHFLHFLRWVPRGLTFIFNAGVLTALYAQNKTMSARDIFIIGISVYGIIWTKVIVGLMVKWKKHDHKRAVLRWLPGEMLSSLLVRVGACFTAIFLIRGVYGTMDLRFFSGLFHGFPGHAVVWLSLLIAVAYIILGVYLMVQCSKEKTIGAGIGYAMGMAIMCVGAFMAILLMLGMTIFAGLCYLTCGVAFYIFVEKSTAGSSSSDKGAYVIVSLVVLGNVISGLGLIMTGLA